VSKEGNLGILSKEQLRVSIDQIESVSENLEFISVLISQQEKDFYFYLFEN
jgi:hypothetical protein